MNKLKIGIAATVLTVGSGAAAYAVAGPGDNEVKITEAQSRQALQDGGVFNPEHLPPAIPAVGPKGCLLTDARGDVILVSMNPSKISVDDSIVNGINTRLGELDEEGIEATVARPADGDEDCTLDAVAITDAVWAPYLD